MINSELQILLPAGAHAQLVVSIGLYKMCFSVYKKLCLTSDRHRSGVWG